jgi:hypothetical protein
LFEIHVQKLNGSHGRCDLNTFWNDHEDVNPINAEDVVVRNDGVDSRAMARENELSNNKKKEVD